MLLSWETPQISGLFGKNFQSSVSGYDLSPCLPASARTNGEGHLEGGDEEGDGEWPAVLVCPNPSQESSLVPRKPKNRYNFPFQTLCSRTFISFHWGKKGKIPPPLAEPRKSQVEKPSFSVSLCCWARGDALRFTRRQATQRCTDVCGGLTTSCK